MPIFGKLNYTMDYSRLMRAMLLNLENGMRIQDALDVSKNVVSNFVMRAMVETSINNILVGTSWIEPIRKSRPWFNNDNRDVKGRYANRLICNDGKIIRIYGC